MVFSNKDLTSAALETSAYDYEFERKVKKEANGDEYEYIGIIPKEESDEMLNRGYVIIDPKSKSILEFKIYTSENHLQNAKTRKVN